ncbi:MAG: VWA domain-containing protein, partial [Anaerolinea sp.]|nr:VWA domain-containing protein [Anaerolinea sp.]
RPVDRLAVVFLVDASDSVGGAARAAQLAFINDAVAALQPDDQAAVVAFGGDALTERPLTPARAFGSLTALRSTPAAGSTDLEEAINLGLALLPADAGRRIVILSDGEQTTGDALRAARRAAASGVAISYARFQRERTPEIQLAEVRAPASVSAGQTFDLDLTVNADQDGPASIRIFADGALLIAQPVDLRAGSNRFALALQAGETGFSDFRVQVDPVAGAADGFFQNNSLAAFSRVIGPPRALIVRVDPDETRYLAEALRASGLIVDETAPDGLPLGLAALEAYDTVVLANVPAVALSEGRMALLQTYVRDLGGGLVVTGGPESYAPGGYFETPLEAMLPVEMQIRDQQRLPQLTIVYVIDRSGSMQVVGPSGVENIELAKEAIIRSIAFLQPTDRAGVVSFDTDGYWIAEIQPVLDRVGLQALVGTLRASGGTDILAGMRLAGTALQTDPSTRKHIILLTDGGAPESGLVALTGALREQAGITTSVIAIGGSPTGFLADMAEAGGGNYHPVEVVAQIPTIFTQEAVLATRAYIVEAPFTPAFAAPSPILDGIDALPTLRGYVAAAPRAAAQTLLTSGAPYNDPILAAWQYGLGRAVAFTSDVTARWAADWVTWADFARFWDQAVRWTIVEGADASLETRVEAQGDSARLIVDARDDAGGFLNGLTLTASLIDPDLTTETLALVQTAPGIYEAPFTPRAEGAYFIGVSGADRD